MPSKKANKEDPLKAYRDKRNAEGTTEPFGSGAITTHGAGGIFVVHMHDATRLHWDLRLEINGSLTSWAIPKPPTLDPNVKRLAIHVEEHPLEYAMFEGMIPKGNYGAGPSLVWDYGRFVAENPKVDLKKDGEIKFSLHGYKLRGSFTLVRTANHGPNHWLLIKKRDDAASDKELPSSSVFSGRELQDLKNGDKRFNAIKVTPPPKTQLNIESISPMLCTTNLEAFDSDDHIFEIKYDGFRLLACKNNGSVKLRYRSGQDATERFPEITRGLGRIPVDNFIIDGEIVAFDKEGKPSFNLLQRRAQHQNPADIKRSAKHFPLSYMVFDLLSLGGDITKQPLHARKALLKQFIPQSGAIRYVEGMEGNGKAFFDAANKMGLEGVVAKKKNSPYLQKRSDHWQRVVANITGIFWIVGYTEPEGSRVGLGGLHLAHRSGEEWIYRGRVGSGLTSDELTNLRKKLDNVPTWKPPFQAPVKNGRWIEPTFLAQVSYRMLSSESHLRFPVWEGLSDSPESMDERPSSPARNSIQKAAVVNRVHLTNQSKVLFPELKYTKGDFVRYHEEVAPWLIPLLQDRPIVMTRYPNGIHGKSFFQKDAPIWTPEWLRTEQVWSESTQRHIRYFVCDGADSLIYLANMAVINIHVWAARLPNEGRPDWCVIDLDPKGAPFRDVVAVALKVKEICDAAGIQSFPKTSGSSGLHILLPLAGACSHNQSKMIARLVASLVEAELPDVSTTERTLEKRHGRVYIDWGQNGHGKLIISAFSARPVEEAAVSMPLQWEEVTTKLTARQFTIKNAVDHLKANGNPMAKMLESSFDFESVITGLEKFIKK